jgi:hypothetical protein
MSTSIGSTSVASGAPPALPSSEASAAQASPSAAPSTTDGASPQLPQLSPGQSLKEMSQIPTTDWERSFGTREQRAAADQLSRDRDALSDHGGKCESKPDCEAKAQNLKQVEGVFTEAKKNAAGAVDYDSYSKWETLRQGAANGAAQAQSRADNLYSTDAEIYRRTGKYPNDNGPFSGDRGTPFGTGEDRIGKPVGRGLLPDFMAVSATSPVPGTAINLHDGTQYVTQAGPTATLPPSAAGGFCPTLTFGWVQNAHNASEVGGFLGGNASQTAVSFPLGRLPVNGVVAVTKALPDGKVAVELGITCPSKEPSVTITPFSTSVPVAAGGVPPADSQPRPATPTDDEMRYSD